MSNPRENRRTAGNRPRVRSGARAVGAFVPKIARAAFETHGFPSASLLTDWPEIIGSEYAAITAPERLVWPRGAEPREGDGGKPEGYNSARRSGATLVLRVEGPRALEIQHIASQLLERINIYFGYRAISQLRLVQGPVHRQPASKAVAPECTNSTAPRDVNLDADIEDESLRAALARLGTAID